MKKYLGEDELDSQCGVVCGERVDREKRDGWSVCLSACVFIYKFCYSHSRLIVYLFVIFKKLLFNYL